MLKNSLKNEYSNYAKSNFHSMQVWGRERGGLIPLESVMNTFPHWNVKFLKNENNCVPF
jgi:hypothetical protein